MFELLIACGCLFVFLAPVAIAWRLTRVQQNSEAQKEMRELDLLGRRCDGTLYSLPGYVVIQPKSVQRRSAGSRVA